MITRRRPLLFVNLLLLAVLACSLPSLVGTPADSNEQTATVTIGPSPTPLPPQVIEVEPAVGEKLAPDQAITLYFDQAMDQASVEGAFEIVPSNPGDLSWLDEHTLQFTPAQPLERGSQYQVTIGAEAKSSQGLNPKAAITKTFTTAGFAEVTQVQPIPSAAGISPTSRIQVAFNQPMVALSVDQPGPNPLRFDPAVSGQGQWVGTSLYVFKPEPALPAGTAITATVDSGLVAPDGALLSSDFSWTFSTTRPQLVESSLVGSDTAVRLDPEIILTFNTPLSTASFEGALQFEEVEGEAVPVDFAWNESADEVTITPTSNLAYASQYSLSFDGATGPSGTPLVGTTNLDFSTVPEPRFIGSDPAPGGTKEVLRSVVLYFSGPMSETSLFENIDLSPSVESFGVSWDGNQNALYVRGDFEPNQSYRLELGQAEDAYGTPLDQGTAFTFRTGNYPPRLDFTRYQYILSFSADQPQNLQLQATNINQVQLSLNRLSMEQFLNARRNVVDYIFNAQPIGDPVRSWTANLSTDSNSSRIVSIPLSQSDPLSTGFYQVIVDTPQDTQPAQGKLLVVRGTELVLKAGREKLLVWAVDLVNGQPLDTFEASLINTDEPVDGSTAQGTDGFAEFTLNPEALTNRDQMVYIGQPGDPSFGFTDLGWDEGINPYQFGVRYTPRPTDEQLYLYTDRPLYRAGQLVYFKGILREITERGYTTPQTEEIELTLYGPNGTELDTLTASLSENGTFNGEFELGSQAMLGMYRISDDLQRTSLYFEVGAYRKPEFELKLTPSHQDRIVGQPLTVEIEADYFFGAPLTDQAVSWQVFSSDYRPPDLPAPYIFSYNRFFPGSGFGTPIADGSGVTDEQGKLEIEIPSEFETDGPRQLTIEATISEEGALPVSGRTQVKVHPSEIYLSVVPTEYSLRADEQAEFKLYAESFLGQSLAQQEAQVEVFRITWQQVVNDEGDLEWQQQERLVNRDRLATEDNGSVLASFVPGQTGQFAIRASAVDEQGRPAEAEAHIWVIGPAGGVWRQDDENRITLIPDKSSYRSGETAQVLVPSPFDDPVTALITIERQTILDRQVLTIPAEGLMLEVPIEANYNPNVYLSAILIKPRTEEEAPKAVVGLVNLPVSSEHFKLNVDMTVDQSNPQPGDEVTYQLRATDLNGNPSQAEFSLSMVDEALLALKDPNSADPFEVFYSQRPLSVGSALGLAITGESARVEEGPLGIGGGGGDFASSVIRQQFEDTAYWNPTVIPDEAGLAQVTVTLPDNLTSWRMEARGVNQATQVGSAEHSLTVSKPLLIRPSTPRFFTAGDRSTVAATVHNNTDASFSVEVRLSANGATIQSTETTSLTLGAGESQRVEWELDVLEVEGVGLTFFAEGGGYQDASTPTIGSSADGQIPVKRYSAPDTAAAAGWLAEADSRTESIALPASFDPSQGDLAVSLEPSLGSVVLRSRAALKEYPYETNRHIAARLMVDATLLRVRTELEADDGLSLQSLEQDVTQSVQTLLSRQQPNGGWGWWSNSNTDPTISAFVLDALIQAQRAGLTIDENAIERAASHLSATVVAPQLLDSSTMNQQAYILKVLNTAGFDYRVTLRGMAQQNDRLPLRAKAFVAQALARSAPNEALLPSLLSDLESAAQLSATGTHWEPETSRLYDYASGIETSAHVVQAFLAASPESSSLPGAVRWLVLNRDKQGGWRTSANTAWATVALLDWVETNGAWQADYSYQLSLNGERLAEGRFEQAGLTNGAQVSQPIANLSADQPNGLTIERGEGEGALSYTAHLTVYQPAEEVRPSSRGLSIERHYFLDDGECDLADNPCQLVDSAQVGDTLLVQVILTVPNEVYYLAAEDHFGAGLEAIDPGLNTSSEQAVPTGDRYGLGWIGWTFDQVEFDDDKVVFFADYLPAGTYSYVYRAHASFAGEYQTLPARSWLTHFPEIYGQSTGKLFTIDP